MPKKRLSSVHWIPLSFFGTILFGAMLLMLPAAKAGKGAADGLTALFTATTSVCVTGLVVEDTFSYWGVFGQWVILFLVQIGGLGVITVTSLIFLLSGRRFSLSDRKMLQDALNLESGSGILRFLVRLIRGTLLVEAAGTCLYSLRLVPRFGFPGGLRRALFLSVSAFCNAGMDINGPDSLAGYAGDPLVLLTTMMLITMGGLGYVVWFDAWTTSRAGIRKHFSPVQIWDRLQEHTKLVLVMSLTLIFLGMAFFLAAEWDNPATIGGMSFGKKLLNALFQSVTLRTAGFSTFPQEGLTAVSCVASYVMMFIGGSPVGTAGGIKTVTFFLAVMNVVSYVRGDNQIHVFRRSVSEAAMRKASVIVSIGVFTVILLTGAFVSVEHVPLEDALFEVISAEATVGLSRGLTGILTPAGRLIIIAAMYLGRIGPISLALLFAGKSGQGPGRYAEGTFYIG